MSYKVLMDFQSGIVGIIGFIGVIITLIANAHLERVKSEEEIRHKRLSLQTALYQELFSIREEIANINSGASDKRSLPFEFSLEDFYVYRGLIKDIGLMQPDQVQAAIRVYRDLYLTMHLLRDLGNDPNKPVVMIEKEKFVQTVKLTSDIRAEIDDVIDKLKVGLPASITKQN